MKKAMIVLSLLFAIYIGQVAWIWQYNNPKANRTTFITHFWQAMKFEKVTEFQ